MQVELEGGGTTTVNRLSSSDPFTGFYQLGDGSLVFTNRDLYDVVNGVPVENPPVIEWTEPGGERLNIFEGEIIVWFLESATQSEIEQVVVDHNLRVVTSWFQPPDEGESGNALACFQFRYDEEEFPTFGDAYAYFTSHPLVDGAFPNRPDGWESTYAGETDPADWYYRPERHENSYINVLGVDVSERVPLGPTGGNSFSNEIIVVIDDGVWPGHPEFQVRTGPHNGWRKTTWLGGYVDNEDLWAGAYLGHPRIYNPDRGTRSSHGTAVAGMLTATTADSRGVAASAPRHAVTSIRMDGYYDPEDGKLKFGETAPIKAVRLLRFAFAHDQWLNRFRVVNMSFGTYNDCHASYWKKMINRDLDISDRLYVAAAGNDYRSVKFYPAEFDNVLGVTGLISDRDGMEFYHYYADRGSNYRDDNYATYPVSGIFDFKEYIDSGGLAWVGRSTSIAPYPYAEEWEYRDDYYNLWYWHFNGTSAATPNVAGLAAVLYDKWPLAANYRSVWNRIVATRDDSKARGYVAGLVDYDAALDGW